jgi:hypothetical protein
MDERPETGRTPMVCDSVWLCSKLSPRAANGVGDCVVLSEDRVCEPVLAEILPDVLGMKIGVISAVC